MAESDQPSSLTRSEKDCVTSLREQLANFRESSGHALKSWADRCAEAEARAKRAEEQIEILQEKRHRYAAALREITEQSISIVAVQIAREALREAED